MKHPTIFLVALAFASCDTSEPLNQAGKPKSLIIGDPVAFGADHWLMFPIGSSYSPEVFEKPKQITHGDGTVEDITVTGGTMMFSYN